MAEHRMIGDILSERRHSLGLSLDRVVADTKLQRRMVEAFEDSDFEAMPPKGYAQASLASYARYLGLNPNEILRVYDDQLYAFERETGLGSRSSSRRGSRRAPDPDELKPSATRPRGRSAQQEQPPARRAGARGYTSDRERDSYADDPYDRGAAPRRDPYASREPYGREDRPAGRARERDRYGAPVRRDPDRDGYGAARDGGYGRASSAAPHARERGLYDSGYRRQDDRRAPAPRRDPYDDGRPVPRRTAAGSPRDDRDRDDRRDWDDPYAPRDAGARGRDRDRQRTAGRGGEPRRKTQVVTIDDGYEGGSGGSAGEENRYRPRRSSNASQRESFGEVVAGFWDSIRSERRTFVVIVGAVSIAVVVVLVVGISSCVRSRGASDTGDGNIPVTPVSQDAGAAGGSDAAGDAGTADADAGAAAVDTTPLAASVDLSALPAGSVLTIAAAAEAVELPFIEVYVDDAAVYAATPNLGDVLTFTPAVNATVHLTSLEGVAIDVNGTAVTPTLDNGTYTLSLAIAQEAPAEGGDAPAEGEAAV